MTYELIVFKHHKIVTNKNTLVHVFAPLAEGVSRQVSVHEPPGYVSPQDGRRRQPLELIEDDLKVFQARVK
jgi:hypothetical protein